ncbi:7,8-didemethyl-8-hydroxy-5-deazariboflavin synthase CofG [Vibrio salinus]|uniref:7,8-didemethyl-8-hydroxy-5-deazariboflavin synthase CofG n=1 Tax=Vibrio salinus TaxID=2899784 RepID=UPI001E61B4EF|nr:7,8-didemethyl-8-hydroxy-5-deazariboflavin synthase CofG [Vibrio salinus]MCE0493696.1 7,8-didemethyl-8-hydroxy-5-deazariboflavin synthase CofG [Vibrio salinus]
MIKRTEAYDLINLSQIELANFLREVNTIRSEAWGNIITYSRKVFIPLTNMCRDQCRYCTFVQTPDSGKARYMTPDAVLRTALQGQNAGCKEALFSLGERPELRYRLAKDLLRQQGYDNTIDYLHDMAELVLNRTLLVPHINAGALSYQELKRLRPVAGSMGMMIESLTDHLMKKGQAHHGCPDKTPQRRLETLRSAGKLNIPFTTGLLIGIGETWQQRIDSLFAINDLYLEYGHIQEVIIQNFRAKAGTPMADYPEPTLHDMMLTLAAARSILHPDISLQAPPNLEQSHQKYLEAGINDWGGISPVTRDFINPERAWPQISQLAEKCRYLGYELSERLTVYPAYLQHKEKYLEPKIATRLASLSSDKGQAAVQCHIA